MLRNRYKMLRVVADQGITCVARASRNQVNAHSESCEHRSQSLNSYFVVLQLHGNLSEVQKLWHVSNVRLVLMAASLTTNEIRMTRLRDDEVFI